MASAATFVAYIDEAGDEGFKFEKGSSGEKGSSEWLVLGAVILRRASEMPEIRLVDDVRARLNRGRKPDRQFPAKKALHFRDLEHDVRKYYAARIAKANLTSVVVLIKKQDLLAGNETSAEEREVRAVLYDVAVLALIETISHHCAREYTADDTGDGSINLVFSSNGSVNYDKLRNTIEGVLADPSAFSYEGYSEREVIRPAQVQAIMHSKSMGLQIADAVTSSYYYAVENSADGFTEDAYVRLLLPCAYQHSGKIYVHGVEFWHCSEDTHKQMQIELSRWER